MSKRVPTTAGSSAIDELFRDLGTAGLVLDRGQAIYELHPALTGYLRTRFQPDELSDAWSRAFVDFMSRLADHFAPKKLHEQRGVFHVHGANFQHALERAKSLEMDTHFAGNRCVKKRHGRSE